MLEPSRAFYGPADLSLLRLPFRHIDAVQKIKLLRQPAKMNFAMLQAPEAIERGLELAL
jgi:hypothetical protein